MEIPPEIRKEIQKVRQDNPQLTANMSDEDIIGLLQQADMTLAHGKPMVFLTRRSKDAGETYEPVDKQSFEKLSEEELIVHAQKLQNMGRWQEAEQAFYVILTKAKETNNILYQSLALLFLGRIHSNRGNQQQALKLFIQAQDLAKNTSDQGLLILQRKVALLRKVDSDYEK